MWLLIDTQAFLWYMAGDQKKITAKAINLIDNLNNDRYLSIAVLWEIAIKNSRNKLELKEPFNSLIPRLIKNNDLSILDITIEHTAAVATLPYPASGHSDPFDRVMIAQCQVEQIPIISSDKEFDNYGIERLW